MKILVNSVIYASVIILFSLCAYLEIKSDNAKTDKYNSILHKYDSVCIYHINCEYDLHTCKQEYFQLSRDFDKYIKEHH